MDVTQDLNRRQAVYGARSTSSPAYTSPNRTLDYAKIGSNINQAQREPVSVLPLTLNYQDTVGLFGVENVYIKLDLNITNTAYNTEDQIENDYKDATTVPGPILVVNTYTDANSDFNRDLFVENTYEPAEINNSLTKYPNPVVSIDLKNLKTGNKYIDTWFDVRLYDRNRIEHAYDRMYVDIKDVVYLGFHARNTKRLPYNVQVQIGEIYGDLADLTANERRFVA